MIILTILKYLLCFILVCAILYGILFLLGLFIPINSKYQPVENGVEFYIGTNGLHTEFILPAVHPSYDWTKIINPNNFNLNPEQAFYYGIGWGDKAIYLDLEDWNQLTIAKGLHCLFVPSTAIMHIKSYDALPIEKGPVERISISPFQYSKLCDFIFNTFALDEKQAVQLIENAGYTDKDNFYQAIGKYHALQTCNSWANQGLKKAGVRTTLWTPTDKGLFYQLKKASS